MLEGCLEDVGSLSGVFWEVVWRLWGGCLKHKSMLSGCWEAIYRVWGGCVEDTGRLSAGWRLSRGYGEAVWKVW